MTDEQKRPPTSEEMIRRARAGTQSSDGGALTPKEPESDDADTSATRATGDESPIHSEPELPAPELGVSRRYPDRSDTSQSRPVPLPAEFPPGPTRSSTAGWLRRLPIGWLIVGLVFAGGWIYRTITAAERDDSGAVVAAGDLASDAFEVGDCLLFPEDADLSDTFEFETLKAVPCSEPHDMEVYAQVTAPEGPFPGENALADLGDIECREPFDSYVGVPVEHEARFTFSVSYPGEEGWDGGDRGLDCLLETADGTRLSGSQQGNGHLGFGGLVVDSCYDYTDTETHVYFDEVSCDGPHLLQLYEEGKVPEGESAPYPGDETVEAAADDLCTDMFFTLIPGDSSPEVDYLWIRPDAETWPFGDRLLQCFLVSSDESPLVRSYATEG